MPDNKTIDNIILPEQTAPMQETIRALSEIAGLPAFHMQQDGTVDWESEVPCFCSLFGRRGSVQRSCPAALSAAASAAARLQEPYVFLCPSAMILFACPAETKEGGTFFIGPLVMDTDRESALAKIIVHFTDNSGRAAAAGAFLSAARIWAPSRISDLYQLLHRLIPACRDPEASLRHSSPDAAEGTSAGRMPYTNTDYPEDPFPEVLKSILSSDTPGALEVFRLFYEKTYLMASGDFDVVRMQIIELFNYLAGKLKSGSAAGFFLENLDNLSRVSTFNEAYTLAEAMIRHLSDSSEHRYGGESPDMIRQALRYIRQHYDQDITLAGTAAQVHLSPSYLSALFKKETGKTFSRCLTDIRLESACRYLRETDRSITDISLQNGFSSQSYFIRVFRTRFGITPKQYRKKHRTPEGVPIP